MHLFLDTVWKLHIGEIPEKPDINANNNLDEYDMDDYNETIAAIKQNALTVGNPGVIASKLDSLEWVGRIDKADVYKWPGGYKTKETPENRDGRLVAILKLPNGKYQNKYCKPLPEEKTPNTLTMKTEPIAIFNPKQISPTDYRTGIDKAAIEVVSEVLRAKELFPSMFINQHEAIAVIREEYLELEQECFKNQRNYDLEAQRKEAKQLAAMAIRLMIELT